MHANVMVNFQSFQTLQPPADRWLMICLLRYADANGRCWPSLRRLARDAGYALATTGRHMIQLEQLGCFTRTRAAGSGYVYQIAPQFLPSRDPPAPPGGGEGSPPVGFRVPPSGAAVPPQRDKKKPVKEALSDDDVPDEWVAAATTERRRGDLPDVDLRVEWRKLVIYAAGEPISRQRWLMWAMRARLDRTNSPSKAPKHGLRSRVVHEGELPDEGAKWESRMRSWRKSRFWMPFWGPKPNEPGCYVPAAMLR